MKFLLGFSVKLPLTWQLDLPITFKYWHTEYALVDRYLYCWPQSGQSKTSCQDPQSLRILNTEFIHWSVPFFPFKRNGKYRRCMTISTQHRERGDPSHVTSCEFHTKVFSIWINSLLLFQQNLAFQRSTNN